MVRFLRRSSPYTPEDGQLITDYNILEAKTDWFRRMSEGITKANQHCSQVMFHLQAPLPTNITAEFSLCMCNMIIHNLIFCLPFSQGAASLLWHLDTFRTSARAPAIINDDIIYQWTSLNHNVKSSLCCKAAETQRQFNIAMSNLMHLRPFLNHIIREYDSEEDSE